LSSPHKSNNKKRGGGDWSVTCGGGGGHPTDKGSKGKTANGGFQEWPTMLSRKGFRGCRKKLKLLRMPKLEGGKGERKDGSEQSGRPVQEVLLEKGAGRGNGFESQREGVTKTGEKKKMAAQRERGGGGGGVESSGT